MHFIAHGEAAGEYGLQGHAVGGAHGLAQRRGQHVAQPRQTPEHAGIVAAEAHDPAQALVEGGIGAIGKGAVLHHQDRHGARGDAGHGPHRPEVVIGFEPHAACRRQFRRRRQIAGPAFEDDGTGNGALHRAAHAGPGDRWAGVQNGFAVAQRRNGRSRRHDVDQHRLGRQHARHGLSVRRRDCRIPEQPGEHPCKLAIPTRRRPPVDVAHRHARGGEVGGELGQADIDDAERLAQQA